MLTAFAQAFRTPDLRRKLLFVLAILALFRLGSVIPTPGVSYVAIQTCLNQVSNSSLYGLINLFSGGALLQLSIFALGIMPYITASIIVQLLTVVIPRFEALKKEGQAGTARLTQYTRYLTIGLAILQSTALIAIAQTPGRLFQGCTADIVPNKSLWVLLTMVITMTAGTGVIMWLGELITDRGIGNGMSLLIFTSIIARFPTQIWAIYKSKGAFIFAVVIAVGLSLVALVVFMEQAQRRIPVQYAKRRSDAGCTAGRPPTSRSRSTWPVSSRSSSRRRCSTSRRCWCRCSAAPPAGACGFRSTSSRATTPCTSWRTSG